MAEVIGFFSTEHLACVDLLVTQRNAFFLPRGLSCVAHLCPWTLPGNSTLSTAAFLLHIRTLPRSMATHGPVSAMEGHCGDEGSSNKTSTLPL